MGKRIFGNSLEVFDWQESNCFRCMHYSQETEREKAPCKLEFDLALACIGNPEPPVDDFIAKGITAKNGWRCQDIQLVEPTAEEE